MNSYMASIFTLQSIKESRIEHELTTRVCSTHMLHTLLNPSSSCLSVYVYLLCRGTTSLEWLDPYTCKLKAKSVFLDRYPWA